MIWAFGGSWDCLFPSASSWQLSFCKKNQKMTKVIKNTDTPVTDAYRNNPFWDKTPKKVRDKTQKWSEKTQTIDTSDKRVEKPANKL
jgi:hypothetical protein